AEEEPHVSSDVPAGDQRRPTGWQRDGYLVSVTRCRDVYTGRKRALESSRNCRSEHRRLPMTVEAGPKNLGRHYAGSLVQLELQHSSGFQFRLRGVRPLPFSITELIA